MKRYFGEQVARFCVAALAAAAICGGMQAFSTAAQIEGRLLSQDELNRAGISRAWFAQAQLNPARNHIERALLTGDRLTVLTSAGVVQEFNALTGEVLWTAPIGNETYPSLGPAVNDKYVALVNGSTLYVLDRTDGRPAIIRQVTGAPGAAPALSEKYVFVPMVSGRMEGYPLESNKIDVAWFYQSKGRSMVEPLATGDSIIWTTDTGYLYVGHSDRAGMRFRLDTGADIVAPTAYLKPFLFVASTSGEVFAMDEMTGARRWKYATGFPIDRAVAPVGNRVYVTSNEPALHCIDAVSGDEFWEAPHVSQFSAVSKTRVYGVDDLGALVILDSANGSLLGRIVADHAIKSLVNEQTDRVYLVSKQGTIECLHETASKQPLYHNPKPLEEKKPGSQSKKQPAKSAEQLKDLESPFEDAGPAAKSSPPPAGEKPKSTTPEKPASDFGTKDDNPFGN
jgi:outer membrane protein assembly factor BamB